MAIRFVVRKQSASVVLYSLFYNTITSLQHWAKKATIHQLTTMLSSSTNVLFPGHNHLLTTDADEPSL